MTETMRGADVLIGAFARAGVRKIFTLSGNHIMPVFDAAYGAGISLIHVRHEAAAVHMADAWARLTGEVGVALVTGGQGHANAVGALCTARDSESPVVLLSGHAPLNELGLGAFQELRQAEMAAPVCKASWTAQSAATLADDLAHAFSVALSGRPGPVHLSLPTDVLEAVVNSGTLQLPDEAAFIRESMTLPDAAARTILEVIAQAERPLMIAPPSLCNVEGRKLMVALQRAAGVPVVGMESPRGINDPGLGAFAEVLAEADLIVLLGKPLDFTLRFGRPPFVNEKCKWIVVKAEQSPIERVAQVHKERVIFSARADAQSAFAALIEAAESGGQHQAWLARVTDAVMYRPPEWASAQKSPDGPLHPAEMCRHIQAALSRYDDAVFVSDGGEIGQWAQAIVTAPHRIINGVAGAIGPSIPFALAAKTARPDATVLAVLGDGTFGFHMAEFETAVRCKLPFVAVVGNDSRWNAEYQIQLREYGAARAHGLDLTRAARYDEVVTALGGHGEFVTNPADLPAALDRAFASGKPACVNVLIESVAAPVVRRR